MNTPVKSSGYGPRLANARETPVKGSSVKLSSTTTTPRKNAKDVPTSKKMVETPVRLNSKEDVTATKKKNSVNGELSRLIAENVMLARKLEDETEVRKTIEAKSTNLVFEIKASQQKKILDLQQFIQLQNKQLQQKDEVIAELEESMKSERTGSRQMQQKLQAAITNKGEEETRAARSIRGSISLMESQLNRTTFDLEQKVNELNAKHATELANLKSQASSLEYKLREQLAQKDIEIQNLEGRLEQARLNRESNMNEMDGVMKSYVKKINKLEAQLQEETQRFASLQREMKRTSVDEKQQLEDELEKTKFEKAELSIRLESIEKEAELKQTKLDEMGALLTRMENSIQAVESQRLELLARTTEYIQKHQDLDKQAGAIEILQEQLEKSQSSLDALKEELVETKHGNKELERSLFASTKELNNTKIDLRISARESKDLEAKVQRLQAELDSFQERKDGVEEQIGKLEKSVKELESERDALKLQIQEESIVRKNLEVVIGERNGTIKDLEANSTATAKELLSYKLKIKEYETLRNTVEERDRMLLERITEVEERDRKIESLNSGILMLKQACTVLESQLTEFEDLLTQKDEQLAEAIKYRNEHENNVTLLKDELRRSKIESNEIKSMQIFAEKRASQSEDTIKALEEEKNREIAILREEVALTKKRAEEVLDKYSTTYHKLEEDQENRQVLTNDVQKLQAKNQQLQDEATRLIRQLVTFKEDNMKLSGGMEEALKKGEVYKEKLESLKEKHREAEVEKEKVQGKLQETIRQQNKVIELLQIQKEELEAKCGRTLVDKLFGRTPTKPQKSIESTPRKLLEEQRALKSLEKEKETLQNELAEKLRLKGSNGSLDKIKAGNNVQKWVDAISTGTLPPPTKKEECILLKDDLEPKQRTVEHRERRVSLKKVISSTSVQTSIESSDTSSSDAYNYR